MASAKIIIWFILYAFIGCSSSTGPYEYHGFCTNMFINRISLIHKLQNCTIILGDLKLALLERTKKEDFQNISFPNLKEVTGFMVMYRVFGLESVGQLFPNLMRIRGNTLIFNYALIIDDMPQLKEIGLYNLLKIDRGGVIIWTGPITCYVDSVNWSAIAPNARHVLSDFETYNRCKNIPCSCTANPSTNNCWNNMKCQRLLEGPEAEKCNAECIGCQGTHPENCSLCRYYTYNDKCVPTCPDGTISLAGCNYCVTIDECTHLDGWLWNNTCVSDCPEHYVRSTDGEATCVPCENCHKTCFNLNIQTIASIQAAAKCVFVKGYLIIHIRALPEAMSELRYYLRSIQEVSDYVEIYGSIVITSLDFLSSLRRIGGENLHSDKYSLVVHDMHNLQRLFPHNVTQNLRVEKGSMIFYRNQILCRSEIQKLVPLFPTPPTELDIPQGLNGYSGICDEIDLNLTVQVKNETSAIATFNVDLKPNVHYTILYAKIPYGLQSVTVPEACSESNWHAISIKTPLDRYVKVELLSLDPATKYAVCVEMYDAEQKHLARSVVNNFTTFVGKPEPPFITELTASSSEVVVIRWVDHLNFLPYIVRYELDVILIDIYDSDILARNHCLDPQYDWEEDYSVHAKVMRPPNMYDKTCESMCGFLSTVTAGAMVEKYFDVYSIIKDCDYTIQRPKNQTVGPYVQKLALNINGKRKDFQVGALAPYRDYKFHLRACTKEKCSTSAANIVKTLKSINADIASITFSSANEQGVISVKWKPPKVINGVVLSYTVEVTPVIIFNNYSLLLPYTFCVPGNTTSLIMTATIANKYLVRLCTTTLASSYSCGDRKKVLVATRLYSSFFVAHLGILGILFGVLMSVTSCVVGWRWAKREDISDDIPLVDATSMYRNESEPPAIMLSDFAPIYSIPLSESYL